MELEKKTWEVTYTKHIKQKRKVYQDGFLDLHISTNKVMLYDDCEKLLECRVLRKEEVVSSGGTLAFNAFLVVVGDHKPQSSCFNTPKLHVNLSNSENARSRTNAKKNTATPSPSHKRIREFKRSELQKYGASQSSPDTKKSKTAEWQVLYTTQLNKKAKTYHDGFLQLSACGSLARQVMLFDESRKLLDSRFLKKDEVVRSGESISLDSHLVEIGECEGDHSQKASNDDAVKVETRTERSSHFESSKKVRKGWQNQNEFTMFQKAESNVNMTKSNMRGESQKTDSLGEYACATSDISSLHVSLSKSVNMNKPLRNAHQILSILSKSVVQEGSAVECTGKSMSSAVCAGKKLQNTCNIEDVPKCSQLPTTSIQCQGSSEILGIEESREYMEIGNCSEQPESWKVTSICGSREVLKDIDSRNSCQSQRNNLEVDAKCCDGATAVSASSLLASKRPDNKRDDSEQLNVVQALIEMPSFDLGF